MFDYYGIVSKEENKKIWDLVHNKFEDIIFFIKFLLYKIFTEQDSSKFPGGLDKEEAGQRRIRYLFYLLYIWLFIWYIITIIL